MKRFLCHHILHDPENQLWEQITTITGFSPHPVLWVSVRPPILQCSIRARTHRVGHPSLSGLERKVP